MNVNKLKGAMIKRDVTQNALAKVLGINEELMCSRFKNGGATFTIGETQKIVNFLRLSREESVLIFFNR